jgi:hypothetical protein
MTSTKPRIRVGVVIFLVFSMLACPLAMNGFTPRSDAHAQIEFTPNVATLTITETAVPVTIGPLVWAPGMSFDCPVGMPERCRPDLANMHGDDFFGWGEILGSPDLRLIWITDETGTHYLVVAADDPQFAGLPDGSSFTDLLEDRMAEIRYLQDRHAEGFGSMAGPTLITGALLVLCPETAGVTCLLAGVTAFGTGVANFIRNMMLSDAASARFQRVEDNLQGRFEQMVLTIVGP